MPHPRIDQFSQLKSPPRSAAALGYRMPAEWEPQSCVWLSHPENPETWPGCLAAAVEQFDDWVDQLCHFVPVCSTQALRVRTNDAWIRDYGPLFVVRQPDEPHGDGLPPLAVHDFRFNGWGQKYEPRELDDLVPQHLARTMSLPVWVHDDFVLEGGAIDLNGRGTVMTTEQCLLNPNRNPTFDRAGIEAQLHAALGTRHVIWLPGGITGDDTDGHIDDVARFVSPTTVVAISAPPGHPDHDVTQRNLDALRAAQDQDGQPLTVLELPVPEPIKYDYPPDRFGPGGRAPVPASYANFLITNGAVFVPVFDQPSDDPALHVMEEVVQHTLPGRTVIPVRSKWLVVGLGAVHCLSQQQPALKRGWW